MILKRFHDEKLAQASYLVGCAATGEALGAVPQTTLGYEKRFNWGLATQSEEEFAAPVDFVRDGLLDPQARPQHLRRLIPEKLPSGRPELVFQPPRAPVGCRVRIACPAPPRQRGQAGCRWLRTAAHSRDRDGGISCGRTGHVPPRRSA